jgi:CheY-like chemotaxis protein
LKIWSTSPHRKPEFTPILLCETVGIIAVTSDSLNGEEQTARAAGCDDYVPKPFSPRELLAKIRKPSLLDCRLFAAVHESAFGTKRTLHCTAANIRYWG